MHKVLIIEDDKIVSVTLKAKLEKKGYGVTQVFNGSAATRKVIQDQPDLILLDIGLPEKSGYDVCKEIRKFYHGRLIFLTAQNSHETEVTCFNLGADDFVPKSAPFEVLYERIKRLASRNEVDKNQLFQLGHLVFNTNRADCLYKQTPLGLTKEEFSLFYYIAIHKGEVISRQRIFQVLKGMEYNGIDRSADIKISRIRNKLKDIGLNPNLITSIRSKGYLVNEDELLVCS